MFKRIDHTEIVTGNLDRTIDFYVGVLGFQVKQRQKIGRPPLDEIAYLTLADTMVELMSFSGASPASSTPAQIGYRMIALEVDDMDKAVEYLKGKGVEIARGPMATGSSKRAEIRDPDGLPIELRQW